MHALTRKQESLNMDAPHDLAAGGFRFLELLLRPGCENGRAGQGGELIKRDVLRLQKVLSSS